MGLISIIFPRVSKRLHIIHFVLFCCILNAASCWCTIRNYLLPNGNSAYHMFLIDQSMAKLVETYIINWVYSFHFLLFLRALHFYALSLFICGFVLFFADIIDIICFFRSLLFVTYCVFVEWMNELMNILFNCFFFLYIYLVRWLFIFLSIRLISRNRIHFQSFIFMDVVRTMGIW